jgi:electron transfer flavoprotein beta subunit
MKVLVCIKRVPAVAGRITLTPDERAIDVRYLGYAIGPHEECAVEEAVRLVEANGGESVVFTLGPAESLEQLRDAMAIGVNRAIHVVTDGEEWDPQATAAAIVDAVRADEAESGPFDLVLMGNEAGDTGDYQVAVRVGYALGRPVVTGLKGLAVTGASARCEQEAAGARDVYEIPMPAVLGVLEGLNLPRYPSVPGRIRAKSKPVATSEPARPAPRLEMIKLIVPPQTSSQAEIIGTGPEAAPAVVELLGGLGVL